MNAVWTEMCAAVRLARRQPLFTALLRRLRSRANVRKVGIRLTALHEQIVGNVLSMRLSLSRDRYRDRAAVLVFQQRLESRLRALPGVQAVGGTSLIPLSGLRASVDFVVDGRPYRADDVPEAEYRVVSPTLPGWLPD